MRKAASDLHEADPLCGAGLVYDWVLDLRRLSQRLADLPPLSKEPSPFAGAVDQGCGGKGIRTPDLLIANETLYQLSYTPTIKDG